VDDKRYSCEHVVPIEQEPRHHLVIENEFVRAFAVEIAPHDRTLCHHHPHDYLLYVVGDGDIVSAARDEEPKKLNYRDGECELLQAGMVHVVENLGDAAFRNVVVELLPRFGELRRGPDPQRKFLPGESTDAVEAGMPDAISRIRPHFESEKVTIFRFKIHATCEVEVSGPAVVASPEGSGLNWKGSGGNPIIINNLNKLAWIPPRVLGVLGSHAAEVVVFQLGISG
jgi:quercetin dioxygenase-like cupin family protein